MIPYSACSLYILTSIDWYLQFDERNGYLESKKKGFYIVYTFSQIYQKQEIVLIYSIIIFIPSFASLINISFQWLIDFFL